MSPSVTDDRALALLAGGVLDASPAEIKGPAGKWTDAAAGERGDLLDVIRESCGLIDFHDVADEARRFLNMLRIEPEPPPKHPRLPAQIGPPQAAQRLSLCRSR